MLSITDITKFTFQDFPGYTSCIIWFGGCNFRCPYCHNPEFVTGNFKTINQDDVFEFLKSRIGLLDGVVLSGGECCLSNNVYDFAKKIKGMGFLLKIDTNGTNFNLIKKLIDEKIVDFIALDYKAPRYKFESIAKINAFDNFEKSLNYMIEQNINMEVRTTVHTKLLNEDDINFIIEDLEKRNYKKSFHVQNFRNDNKQTLEDIGEQERVIDKNLITKKSFEITFRNFLYS